MDAEHHEQPRAHVRGLAVGGHVDHGLQVHVVEQCSFTPTDGTQVVHVLPHAILPDEHAAPEDFDYAIWSEQIRDIVLPGLIDIVPVGTRDVLERLEVAQALELVLCGGDRVREIRDGRGQIGVARRCRRGRIAASARCSGADQQQLRQ